MRLTSILSALLAASCACALSAKVPAATQATSKNWAVGPQYDSTHVYVAPEDLDPFMASFIATFGGTASKARVTSVTPTPSETVLRFILSPVGTLSLSLRSRTDRIPRR
jgi:Flp pilus assembly protein CpaB